MYLCLVFLLEFYKFTTIFLFYFPDDPDDSQEKENTEEVEISEGGVDDEVEEGGAGGEVVTPVIPKPKQITRFKMLISSKKV